VQFGTESIRLHMTAMSDAMRGYLPVWRLASVLALA
jgi:hypothetical protein